MSRPSKAFAGSVVVVAAIGLAGALFLTPGVEHWAMFGHCLALGLLTSTFKIRLPGMRSSIAASFVLFLVAMASLNVAETLILTIPCTVLQCLWRPKSRPAPIQVTFSVASTLISTSVAALLYFSVARTVTLVPASILAATAFFLVNSLVIATITGLVSNRSIGGIWRGLHRWALPYYLGGAIVAVLVVAYGRVAGFHQSLSMTLLLYSVYLCYDTYVTAESKRIAHGELQVT